MRVLVACEYSGVVRNEFNKLGHEAWSCDLLPTEIPGNHHQGDVRDLLSQKWDLIIAHPPCTYLTVSGNRWFRPEYKDRYPTREEDRKQAIEFFLLFTNVDCPKVCIENPVGIMSTVYKKPTQIIQPYQFGHTNSKKTCLWLKGLPKLIPTDIVEPVWHVMYNGKRMDKEHANAKMSERSKIRSKTYLGIAKAMAEQWGK